METNRFRGGGGVARGWLKSVYLIGCLVGSIRGFRDLSAIVKAIGGSIVPWTRRSFITYLQFITFV